MPSRRVIACWYGLSWACLLCTGPYSVICHRTLDTKTNPMPLSKFPKFGKKSEHIAQSSSSQSSPPPDSMSDIAWSGLLSTLPIVQQSLGAVPVPGLQVAVGGLLHIIQGLDVRES